MATSYGTMSTNNDNEDDNDNANNEDHAALTTTTYRAPYVCMARTHTQNSPVCVSSFPSQLTSCLLCFPTTN